MLAYSIPDTSSFNEHISEVCLVFELGEGTYYGRWDDLIRVQARERAARIRTYLDENITYNDERRALIESCRHMI